MNRSPSTLTQVATDVVRPRSGRSLSVFVRIGMPAGHVRGRKVAGTPLVAATRLFAWRRPG
jgi:hypothetical protein